MQGYSSVLRTKSCTVGSHKCISPIDLSCPVAHWCMHADRLECQLASRLRGRGGGALISWDIDSASAGHSGTSSVGKG